jgi:hypothetical protein
MPGGGRSRRLVLRSVIQARKQIGAPHLKQSFTRFNALTCDFAVDAGRVFWYLPNCLKGGTTARTSLHNRSLRMCRKRLTPEFIPAFLLGGEAAPGVIWASLVFDSICHVIRRFY